MSELKAITPVVRHVEGAGVVHIVLASLNTIDHDSDVTLKGFFGHQVAQIVPSHDWSHVPLGRAVIREEGNEAVAELQFNLRVDAAADWYESIKFDFETGVPIQEFSYGFEVKSGGSRPGEYQGQRVRFLQPLSDGSPGVEIFEVSPVLRGAGVGTRTLAVKHARTTGGHVDPATRDELLALKARLDADSLAGLKGMREKFYDDIERAQLMDELRGAAVKAGILTAYRGVDGRQVSANIRNVATEALKDVRATGVQVRWFAQANKPEGADFTDTAIAGFCRPAANAGEIFIRADIAADKVYETVAHEVDHLRGGDEDHATAAGLRALAQHRGWL